MSKIVAIIPARLASTRLPNKLMKVLHGKTIIRRTYEAVLQTHLFDDVIVACDDVVIFNEIELCGGKAMISSKMHESGTDRIAEIAENIEADIIVNIQGDEPFISKKSLSQVISLFDNKEVQVGSLMLPISDIDQINNPNCVKVVVDKNNKALYFSRSPIPFFRNKTMSQTAYQHIGVYAFRKEALLQVAKLPVSDLEMKECLENLRMLENGIPIHLAIIDHVGISIDTEEDFIKAETYLSGNRG